MGINTNASSRRQTFTFNGKSSKDYLLYLSGPGVYDSPEVDAEQISVPGVNGDILRDNALVGMRRYANVDIKYKAFFFNGLPAKTSDVKSWLLSPVGYKELSDTYDPDFFRLASCTQALSFDVTDNKVAEMEITFNCKPQRYSYAGQEETLITESGTVITNPYEFYSQPVIVVYGTDEGTLTIGDYSVKIYNFTETSVDASGTASSYVKHTVTLNSETQNAYYEDGEFCNDNILSDYFPILSPGDNKITWDGGITGVSIIPRWWTL